MKVLFSPPDPSAVKLLHKKLRKAGIPCELRKNPMAEGIFGMPSFPELWI